MNDSIDKRTTLRINFQVLLAVVMLRVLPTPKQMVTTHSNACTATASDNTKHDRRKPLSSNYTYMGNAVLVFASYTDAATPIQSLLKLCVDKCTHD
jgi:hypothetical protein